MSERYRQPPEELMNQHVQPGAEVNTSLTNLVPDTDNSLDAAVDGLVRELLTRELEVEEEKENDELANSRINEKRGEGEG